MCGLHLSLSNQLINQINELIKKTPPKSLKIENYIIFAFFCFPFLHSNKKIPTLLTVRLNLILSYPSDLVKFGIEELPWDNLKIQKKCQTI